MCGNACGKDSRVARVVKWNLALCLANDVSSTLADTWLKGFARWAGRQNKIKRRNRKRCAHEINGNKMKEVWQPMGSCQCSSGEGQESEEGRRGGSCRHVQAAGNPINVANALASRSSQSAKQLRIYLTPSQAIKHFSFIHGRCRAATHAIPARHTRERHETTRHWHIFPNRCCSCCCCCIIVVAARFLQCAATAK